jgi:hypothetical protein
MLLLILQFKSGVKIVSEEEFKTLLPLLLSLLYQQKADFVEHLGAFVHYLHYLGVNHPTKTPIMSLICNPSCMRVN